MEGTQVGAEWGPDAPRRWYIQPQLGFESSKENIHVSVNPASARWMDALPAALREQLLVTHRKQLYRQSGDGR